MSAPILSMLPGPHRHRGVALFVTLIVLVAMTIAGLALMRSVGGNLMVAGNLGFKRAATSAGDLGLELGRQWLITSRANGINLEQSIAADGYHAEWMVTFDPSTHDWDAQSGPNVGGRRGATDAHENIVHFVIHRLCATVGAPTPDRCVTSGAGGTLSSGRVLHYMDPSMTAGSAVSYRVTARVVGAKRNTVSYVQAIVTL